MGLRLVRRMMNDPVETLWLCWALVTTAISGVPAGSQMRKVASYWGVKVAIIGSDKELRMNKSKAMVVVVEDENFWYHMVMGYIWHVLSQGIIGA